MDGGTSEQRHMDVACERFRKHAISFEHFRKTRLANGTPSEKAAGGEEVREVYITSKGAKK